jgi:hypothetical protein
MCTYLYIKKLYKPVAKKAIYGTFCSKNKGLQCHRFKINLWHKRKKINDIKHLPVFKPVAL